ncbi:distal tail protein Dit [Lacticaseibacillus paracasei]|uniref:distal tail protein Dit n=1 Tax=Lacticaseibacillus paracasei TaxID=1597 RepID=UPI00192C57FC|nr:distal tail protein Dit [Lacticaseibacillus paracasei]CAD7483822.1 Phage tail protein [Lacticaseibacillus paracasei]
MKQAGVTITYAGVDITQWMYVQMVERDVGTNHVNTMQKVGISDGQMLQYMSRDVKTIVVTGIVMNDNLVPLRRSLAAAIDTDEPQQLIFGDEPDKYYLGIVDSQPTFTEGFRSGTISISFICPDGGIAHSVATKTFDNKDPKWNGSPLNLLTGTSNQETSETVGINSWNAPSKHPNISVTPGQKFAYQIFITNDNTVDLTAGVDAFSGTAWKATYVGNVIKAGTSGYSSVTFTIPSGTDNIVANAARLVARVPTATTTVYWQEEKLNVGTTVSPWSPNPADPEYYTNTITVPNAGTYPSEPVITATINGDDGVLTAINDQGSVLQFGSPDETDGFVKQKSERVYHLDFNQTPTGVTLNNGVTAFPYYEHGNDANVQSGPFGYANGIAYPSTERTASNYWNGPSMSGTIPKNSNGSNTANFQFVNRVNVGTNAAEVGRFEFNLTYQGKIVASLALFDDSASNDQWVFSGTVYDGSQAQMIFWDLLPHNYYRDGNYNAVITKMGDQLTFRLDRIDLGDGGIETRTVSGFSKVPIDGWTAWFPGFSDQRGWSINWQDSYFEWINVDYWDDIPNRFKDGDVVQIDVANRRVLVNGAEDRTLQTIGNDWGGFKIQPGNNTIELLTSSWAKQCKAEVSWQEAFV